MKMELSFKQPFLYRKQKLHYQDITSDFCTSSPEQTDQIKTDNKCPESSY